MLQFSFNLSWKWYDLVADYEERRDFVKYTGLGIDKLLGLQQFKPGAHSYILHLPAPMVKYAKS